jgi:3-hydroxyacyl-[acyl-carrier-protein] dehydratase
MEATNFVRGDHLAGKVAPFIFPRDLYVEEIEQLLPHRGEILFARHVRLLGPEHYQGFVTWEPSSMGIAGHFPSFAIVPAVYLLEAAAQIAGAGMLATAAGELGGHDDQIGVFAGTRRCMFKQPVLPGQPVVFDLRIKRASGGVVFVDGSASVDGKKAATLDFMLAQTSRAQIRARSGMVPV